MTALPVAHSTFVIERELPASPRHAYRFWSEAALKQRWNECHPDWVIEESFDFRVGGIEAKRWRMADGSASKPSGRFISTSCLSNGSSTAST